MVQPLQETVWQFLIKLNLYLAYDPAIPLPGIHPRCKVQFRPRQKEERQPCHASVCSSIFCLVTTKIWSDGRQSPLGEPQLSGLGQTMLQLSGLKWTVLQLLDKSVLQLSVTALFYLEDSRKIHLRGVRACRSKDMRRRAPQRVGERERELALAPLFICLSLPGPVLCKLGQPGVVFVLPEVLTPVLGPSFALFSRALPFSVF